MLVSFRPRLSCATAVKELLPLTRLCPALAKVLSAYRLAPEPLTVTDVAAAVVVPRTVAVPLRLALLKRLRLSGVNVATNWLLVRCVRLLAAS
jgi:hypothetical protein